MPNQSSRSKSALRHARRGAVCALAALEALIAVGCTDVQRGSEPASHASELPIVRVDEANSRPTPMWSSVREFTTQNADTLLLGGGESLFARFLPDGSLAIANGSRIVRLNANGSFANVIARNGDGPGEFRMVLSLGVAADGSLFASDFLTGRLTRLTPGGKETRTVRRLRPYAEDLHVVPFAVLPGDRTLAAPWQWQAARRSPSANTGLARDSVAVVVYDSQGEIVDTIAVLPGLERSQGFVAPFARSALLGARGTIWAAGTSDSLDLIVYHGTTAQVRLVAPGLHASPTSRERARRDSAVAAKFGRDIGPAVIKRLAAMPLTERPELGGLLVDAAGRIWVGGYVVPGEPTRLWSIYSAHGTRLGQLTLPAFGDALLPSRTELLDAAESRIALIRESPDGEIAVEVWRVNETK